MNYDYIYWICGFVALVIAAANNPKMFSDVPALLAIFYACMILGFGPLSLAFVIYEAVRKKPKSGGEKAYVKPSSEVKISTTPNYPQSTQPASVQSNQQSEGVRIARILFSKIHDSAAQKPITQKFDPGQAEHTKVFVVSLLSAHLLFMRIAGQSKDFTLTFLFNAISDELKENLAGLKLEAVSPMEAFPNDQMRASVVGMFRGKDVVNSYDPSITADALFGMLLVAYQKSFFDGYGTTVYTISRSSSTAIGSGILKLFIAAVPSSKSPAFQQADIQDLWYFSAMIAVAVGDVVNSDEWQAAHPLNN